MFIRSVSAIVGILLLVLIRVFFENLGIVVFSSFISLIACYEYAKMFKPQSQVIQTCFVFFSFSLHLLFGYLTQSFLLIIGFYFLIILFSIFQRKQTTEDRFLNINHWFVGVLYCGLLTGIVALGIQNFKLNYFIALLIASFSTDTFAYLGGRVFGKIPLAPKISPNKTIEGAITGLIGGSIPTFFFLNSLEHSSPIYLIIIFSLFASLFSQLGDLYESMIKRIFNVKDSGKILPGHGGALDRIDGLLFSAPIIYLWMSIYLIS